METAKLTVQLPKRDLEFAEQYARARRITLSELIDRYLRRLRIRNSAQSPSDSRSGPAEADAWQELFRVGDVLAAEDPPGSQTLTAAVLAMRR